MYNNIFFNKIKKIQTQKKKTPKLSDRTVGTSATWEQVRTRAESHLHSEPGTWYHLAMSPCVPFLLHSHGGYSRPLLGGSLGTSWVVQWLRIHLAMQGTRV